MGFKGLGVNSGEGAILTENKTELIEKIIELLSDQSYRKTVGERGKEIVTENFGWDKVSENLEKYFLKLFYPNKNGKQSEGPHTEQNSYHQIRENGKNEFMNISHKEAGQSL